MFDLDQSFFIFYSEFTLRGKCARIGFKLGKDYSANGEISNTSYDFRMIIDISHDRFLTGKWRLKWRNEAHRICKEESIMQKNHPERSII